MIKVAGGDINSIIIKTSGKFDRFIKEIIIEIQL